MHSTLFFLLHADNSFIAPGLNFFFFTPFIILISSLQMNVHFWCMRHTPQMTIFHGTEVYIQLLLIPLLPLLHKGVISILFGEALSANLLLIVLLIFKMSQRHGTMGFFKDREEKCDLTFTSPAQDVFQILLSLSFRPQTYLPLISAPGVLE